MGNKILLLTDFSLCSWNAIRYAIKLYEHRPCDFYILNTYRKESHGYDQITLDPENAFNTFSENRSRKGLGRILIRISGIDTFVDHRFYVLSLPNTLAEAVRSVVKTQEIKLIFMGAKGVGNADNARYGTNTSDIIQQIRSCPVMVVPAIIPLGPPKEIVLATNFHADFDYIEIAHLAEVGRVTKAKIKVLSLTNSEELDPQQKKCKDFLHRHFEGIDYNFQTITNTELEEVWKRWKPGTENMLSFIHKKPSFWERWGFRKCSLAHLARLGEIPVLALHG